MGMTAWILKISEDYPDHWEIARECRYWDTHHDPLITAGDEVFFWMSGHECLASVVRATSNSWAIGNNDQKSKWRDKDSKPYYTHRFTFDVVAEGSRSIKWSEMAKIAHVPSMANRRHIEVHGEGARVLRELFTSSPSSASARG